jgi:hypothetical protein
MPSTSHEPTRLRWPASAGREDAARTFGRTKDVAGLTATMGRLEVEERIAREPVETRRLSPREVVAYARSLPRLWADAAPDGRQALVTAVFADLAVAGFSKLEDTLSEDAVDLGLDAALPPILELGSNIGEFGRGERICASHTDLSIEVIRLAPAATPAQGLAD